MSLLQVQGLTKSYGGLRAVDGASFGVEQGSITALIGPNGAGKTTAFDIISGVVEPDSGWVKFDGDEITGLMPHVATGRGLGRTFQITRELGDLTVIENMLVPTIKTDTRSLLGPKVRRQERDRALDLLAFAGIDKLALEPAKRLSYGQRKLLELMSVMMVDPRLVLLDEPAGGVNPVLIEKIMDRIEALNAEGVSFLIVEHNMEVVMRLASWVIVMAHGKVLLEGTPSEVQQDERVLAAYLGEA